MEDVTFKENESGGASKKITALDAAMRHLSYRDKTVYEVREHLKSKGYLNAEIDEAIAYLKEMKYVDDANYAKRYAESSARKGKGIIKIEGELSKKGIADDVMIDLLLEEEIFGKENERMRALKQAEKLISTLSFDFIICEGDDYDTKTAKYKEQQKVRGKIGRKLMGLGYTQEMVFSVLSEVMNELINGKE